MLRLEHDHLYVAQLQSATTVPHARTIRTSYSMNCWAARMSSNQEHLQFSRSDARRSDTAGTRRSMKARSSGSILVVDEVIEACWELGSDFVVAEVTDSDGA
jgi:hypothetical protein